MQYILTKTGKRIPFYNVRKVTDGNNLPVSLIALFRETDLQEAGFTSESLKADLKNSEETVELATYNQAGALLNTYCRYSKLDEISCKYDYLISPYVPAIAPQEAQTDENGNITVPAIEGAAEIPEVKDTMLMVTLLKQSELEIKVEDTSKTVDAMAVAMAEMMGVQDMPTYKKIIFLKAIRVRFELGEGTVETITETYTKLTAAEKEELKNEF